MSKEDTCVLYFTEKDVRLSITYVNKKCNILRDLFQSVKNEPKLLSKETKNTTNMFLYITSQYAIAD